MHTKPAQPNIALLASAATILTVLVLIALKMVAYLDNGSASILASLIDSVMDASVSCMTFLALRLSLKPADREHRHGHGKIEGLAALFQASFIAAAGIFLLIESFSRFHMPPVNGDHAIAVAVMAIAAFLSAMIIFMQNYALKRAPSLAIEADRAHYSMDVLINLGAMGVVVALRHGLPAWIDPVFAIIVALYLGWTARGIGGKALDMLLDRELGTNVRAAIKAKVLSHEKVLGMHDLRTSRSGMRVFISFDIELDPQMLLCDAHEIVREVEHALLAGFPEAEILIHVDPFGDTDDTRHHVAGVHDIKY
ncbi:MAG: cation diffusion facilitator family transporter [Alphaproteobacteria bacterium]